MDEDVKTLGDYVSIAWRRKFHIAIPFVLILIVALATVLVLPPVYRSTGTIAIESQQIPSELVQSTVTSFADERIQVIKQRIMTGEQLFAIIDKFGLFADEIGKRSRTEILDDMRSRIAIELVSANVRNRWDAASATIAFTISFEDRNPDAAQKVANELVTLFLDENIKTRTARAEETTEFFKKEAERLGKQMALIQEQIATYKQENEGSLPENLRVNIERVANLKAALLDSKEDINQLDERKKLLEIELDSIEYEAARSGGLSEEQERQKQELANLQNRFIALSARYGAEHPDVKAVKRQILAFEGEYGDLRDIEDLKLQEQETRQEMLELTKKYSEEHPDVKRLERRLEGVTAMIDEVGGKYVVRQRNEPNPELMQVRARLESVNNSIARIENNRTDLQNQIYELDRYISRTPQVERGLEALERDYENTTLKYEEMKAKELQAELSKNLEQEQKGERFTLLEPPLYPDYPIKPNRRKMMLLGVILSMVGGIGVAGVAESLDSGVRGSRALASITKMTPLVAIPYIQTRRDEVLRSRNIKVIIAAMILAGLVFLGIIHFLYRPLDQLWFILLRNLNLA